MSNGNSLNGYFLEFQNTQDSMDVHMDFTELKPLEMDHLDLIFDSNKLTKFQRRKHLKRLEPTDLSVGYCSSLTKISKILESDTFKMLEKKKRNCVLAKNSKVRAHSVSKFPDPSVSTILTASQPEHIPINSNLQNSQLNINRDVSNVNDENVVIRWLPTKKNQTSHEQLLNEMHKRIMSTDALPQNEVACANPSGLRINKEIASNQKIKKKEKMPKPQRSLPSPNVEVNYDSLTPTIQNITGTINISCEKIDLKRVKLLRNTYYDPETFAAVIMRLPNPKTTALIFSTGKIVCTGANSIEITKKACRIYARIIQKLGYSVEVRDFKIENMVVCYHLPFYINLQKLYNAFRNAPQELKLLGDYVPEIFPGLKCKIGVGKTCAKIFLSGKVIMTGTKSLEDAMQGFKKVFPIISECRYAPNALHS